MDLLLASKEGGPHGTGGWGTLLPARPRLDTPSCPPRPCAGPGKPHRPQCPVVPSPAGLGGVEVRPQGGQLTVGMFVQDLLLVGSPFLRTGSRDLASPPGTVDTESLWPWELPWAFPGVERHPASTPWGPAASASVVMPPKRPQMCPGIPTEPPRRQYEALTEHPTFC